MSEEKSREYCEEALWTALKAARKESVDAEEDYTEADRVRDRARNRKESAKQKVDTLKVALDAVLDGLASVKWDDTERAFFVRFRERDWSGKREGRVPSDMRLEQSAGSTEVRAREVPHNAIPVGSSNQSKVGNWG